MVALDLQQRNFQGGGQLCADGDRSPFGVQINGDRPGTMAKQVAQLAESQAIGLEAGGRAEITQMGGQNRFALLCQAQGIVAIASHGQNGHRSLKPRWQANRCRSIPTRSPEHLDGARQNPHDRVVHAMDDRLIVQEERIGDGTET